MVVTREDLYETLIAFMRSQTDIFQAVYNYLSPDQQKELIRIWKEIF